MSWFGRFIMGVDKQHFPIRTYRYPSQEWVAAKLNICLVIVSGMLRPGLLAQMAYNTSAPETVWLHHCFSTDGSGKRSSHFTFLSQAQEFQINLH